jgi:hypothetical protein
LLGLRVGVVCVWGWVCVISVGVVGAAGEFGEVEIGDVEVAGVGFNGEVFVPFVLERENVSEVRLREGVTRRGGGLTQSMSSMRTSPPGPVDPEAMVGCPPVTLFWRLSLGVDVSVCCADGG